MSADFCSLLPRQVALPTEAWRGAEICRRLAENGYVNLPGPRGTLSCLTHNYYISLKKLDRVKHSSLFCPSFGGTKKVL
jgi:hypothetical protein